MKLLGRKIKIFGGGMRKVNFILPFAHGKDVLDVGIVAHRKEAYNNENFLHKNLSRDSAVF